MATPAPGADSGPESEDQLECPQCGGEFDSITEMQAHVQEEHI